MRRLLPLMKESRFFKEREMEDEVILRIATIAGYSYCQANDLVFE